MKLEPARDISLNNFRRPSGEPLRRLSSLAADQAPAFSCLRAPMYRWAGTESGARTRRFRGATNALHPLSVDRGTDRRRESCILGRL